MYFVTVDFNIEQFKDFWWVLDFYIWAYFDTSFVAFSVFPHLDHIYPI